MQSEIRWISPQNLVALEDAYGLHIVIDNRRH